MFTNSAPKVRAWVPEAAAWTSDGIEEYEWQSTKRVIRLHTTRSIRQFGAITTSSVTPSCLWPLLISTCPLRRFSPRVGAIAIVQDRACDLAYASWRLTPIYDPDPLTASVEGIDDGEMLPGDLGRRFVLERGGGL